MSLPPVDNTPPRHEDMPDERHIPTAVILGEFVSLSTSGRHG